MSLHSKSESLYAQAQQLIPGGVNSPVRAFTGVGGVPLFIERADGAYLFMVRKLNRPLLGFLTMNCGRKEPHMVLAVAE